MRKTTHCGALLLALAAGAVGQIHSEITDAAERNALRGLSAARPASERLELSKTFASRWPRSAFLADALAIGAQAALDLGGHSTALPMAAESLDIMPENPALLAAIAPVLLSRKDFERARLAASDALEYLDWFAGPSAVSERDWVAIERELRLSALRTLANASVALALAANDGVRRKSLLHSARQSLETALQLKDDPDIVWTLALSLIAAGELEHAAKYLKYLMTAREPLARRAEQRLRSIHAALRRDIGWAAFLDSISSPPRRSPSKQPLTAIGLYAGSEACRPCHAREYEAWRSTGMARMLQPWSPGTTLTSFRENHVFHNEEGLAVARTGDIAGRPYIEVAGPRGSWSRHFVDHVIGSKWQQAYATRVPNGSLHVIPIQYNFARGQWLNYWQMIDPPGSRRADLAAFHNLDDSTSYTRHCASCHTSQLAAAQPENNAIDSAAFREPGINCEMCHGPAAGHIEGIQRAATPQREPLDPPVSFPKLDHRSYVAICAQCHMQSAVREMGSSGEVNYSDGGSFFRRYKSRPYSEFSRKAFYRDGRFRETTFIVESFRRSKCFRVGEAHCGHCHNPHPPDAASNRTSLKWPADPDRMCLQCHSSYTSRLEGHTHHSPSSEGSRCVSCHMPPIMNSLLFQAASHQIDDRPGWRATERFGQAESPNACLLCHAQQNVSWVREQIERW